MKTFTIHSLGCKVNQYDGQLLREHFLAAGYVEQKDLWAAVVESPQEDTVVLNTCTVTEEADKECARIVRKLKRLRPGAKIIVTGCAVTDKDQALLQEPGIDLIIPNTRKQFLLDEYAAMMHQSPSQSAPPSFIRGFQGHCRAFVKIQDGCNEFCSFCKIPFVRGRNKSRPLLEIRREVEALLANGYQEIVFTGVHAGNFGLDKHGDASQNMALAALVEEIHDLEALRRIRFSSLEPMNVSRALIDRLAQFPKVCPHFHLPLQSGDDVVLRHMKRRYTTAQYRAMAEALRSRFVDMEITTDIIVGFPGETAIQFENTLRFAQEMQFLKVHVFPYSPRPGTLAAGFADHVPDAEIKRRCVLLGQEAEKLAATRRALYLGRIMDVLVEGKTEPDGSQAGFTANYLKVLLANAAMYANSMVAVRLLQCKDDHVRAVPEHPLTPAISSLPLGY